MIFNSRSYRADGRFVPFLPLEARTTTAGATTRRTNIYARRDAVRRLLCDPAEAAVRTAILILPTVRRTSKLIKTFALAAVSPDPPGPRRPTRRYDQVHLFLCTTFIPDVYNDDSLVFTCAESFCIADSVSTH